jgi:very-short-patch-repair endonuclease
VPRRSAPLTLDDAPFRGSVAVAGGRLTRRQLSGPHVRRLFPDIYVATTTRLDHRTWCAGAALLLPPTAAISDWSALSLFCPSASAADNAPVEVSVPSPANLRQHPRLRIHRGVLDPADVVRVDGLPVTSPARTAFDLARRRELLRAVIGLDALLTHRLVTKEQIGEYAQTHSSLHGARHVAPALDLATQGAESPMETRLRLVLVLAGLPTPEVQYEVPLTGALTRIDLAYPQQRLGVEVNGGDAQAEADRLEQLHAAGWTVMPFSGDDVLRRPERVASQVRAALAG